MVVNFLTDSLYMHINGTGIAYVVISPDMVEKLFSGKNLVRR